MKRTNSCVSVFSNGRGCFRIDSSSHGGRVAQLGEHLLCKQGVAGSNPVTSTTLIRTEACGYAVTSISSFDCFSGSLGIISGGTSERVPNFSVSLHQNSTSSACCSGGLWAWRWTRYRTRWERGRQ
jgi:hypothetical protein